MSGTDRPQAPVQSFAMLDLEDRLLGPEGGLALEDVRHRLAAMRQRLVTLQTSEVEPNPNDTIRKAIEEAGRFAAMIELPAKG